MSDLVIKKCTIADLEGAPNIQEILDEYAAESSPSIKGLPRPLAKVDTYKHLESINAIHIIGAFFKDVLVGYIIIVAPVLPHYSIRIAVSESYFVLKSCRGTGAGTKLREAAEKWSKEAGAIGILMSAPLDGDLAEVLPHVGYQETGRVFFKSFKV